MDSLHIRQVARQHRRYALMAITVSAVAASTLLHGHGIDSGGGASSAPGMKMHTSLGSPFATAGGFAGEQKFRPGRIEVLFPTVVLDPWADTDGNGLPDAWELLHFGTIGVDPHEDADGDGTTNLMEFLAGTDPRDPTSVFRPDFRQGPEGQFILDVSTIHDRIYRIWGGSDLDDWEVLETLTGDDSMQSFSADPASIGEPRYFFRVEIALP